MSFFNPFHHIVETKDYPYARILRTNFFEKWNDTLEAFHGYPDLMTAHARWIEKERSWNVFPPWKDWHIGVTDYLTFIVPWLLVISFGYVSMQCMCCVHLFADKVEEIYNAKSKGFFRSIMKAPKIILLGTAFVLMTFSSVLLSIPAFLLEMSRALLSFALAMTTFPLVAITHLISEYIAKPIKAVFEQFVRDKTGYFGRYRAKVGIKFSGLTMKIFLGDRFLNNDDISGLDNADQIEAMCKLNIGNINNRDDFSFFKRILSKESTWPKDLKQWIVPQSRAIPNTKEEWQALLGPKKQTNKAALDLSKMENLSEKGISPQSITNLFSVLSEHAHIQFLNLSSWVEWNEHKKILNNIPKNIKALHLGGGFRQLTKKEQIEVVKCIPLTVEEFGGAAFINQMVKEIRCQIKADLNKEFKPTYAAGVFPVQMHDLVMDYIGRDAGQLALSEDKINPPAHKL